MVFKKIFALWVCLGSLFFSCYGGALDSLSAVAIIGKTALAMSADATDISDLSASRLAACKKFACCVLDCFTKCAGKRTVISKGISALGNFFQGAKTLEEFAAISRLKKKHGDVATFDVLQKFYKIAENSSQVSDELADIDEKKRSSWRARLKPALRLAEMATSLFLLYIGSGGIEKLACYREKHVCQEDFCDSVRDNIIAVQRFFDCLIRYLCNEKEFIPRSKFCALESYATLGMCVADGII